MTHPSAPADEATQDTLALIAGDRVHRTDRQILLDAIETVAARNGGTVDPNELRAEVHGLVYPKVIGATINGLARTGHLTFVGWTVTRGSATGNDGKPCRTYFLNSLPADPRATSPYGAGREEGREAHVQKSHRAAVVSAPEAGTATPPDRGLPLISP